MKILAIMVGVFALSGCQLIAPAFDKVMDSMVDQVNEYCAMPYSDRLGAYVIINGRLIDTTVTIECPGDPEPDE